MSAEAPDRQPADLPPEGLSVRFGRVDETPDPSGYVRLLDRQRRRPLVRVWKRRSLNLLRIRPGAAVLDVGCGTGEDVRDLAALVGPSGRVVGVDTSTTMIAEAKRRAEAAGLANVEFATGDVRSLRFKAESFDAVRSERLLLYVPESDRAVAELARVCRRGGRVACLEPDPHTWVLDTPERDLQRRLVDFMLAGIPNPTIGRQLRRHMVAARLAEVHVEPLVDVLTDYDEAARLLELVSSLDRPLRAGVVSQGEAKRWFEVLRRAGERGEFFWSMTWFLAAGVRVS